MAEPSRALVDLAFEERESGAGFVVAQRYRPRGQLKRLAVVGEPAHVGPASLL